ncbi:MAG: hypothetical protein MZV64_25920 [Ignavibacteriales bacterium]|nr:hypothetical protein [Ignavibacteriales bacterium]
MPRSATRTARRTRPRARVPDLQQLGPDPGDRGEALRRRPSRRRRRRPGSAAWRGRARRRHRALRRSTSAHRPVRGAPPAIQSPATATRREHRGEVARPGRLPGLVELAAGP